jgi:5-methylcytosine-specific restriction endonuclease McrA
MGHVSFKGFCPPKLRAHHNARMVMRDGHCLKCGAFMPEQERLWRKRVDGTAPYPEPCRACRRAKARLRTTESRRKERQKRAAKNGRVYRTLEELRSSATARAADRAAKRAAERASRPRPASKKEWIARYERELPTDYTEHQYKPSETIYWHARYALDPEFKAKEIERTRRRKAKRFGITMQGDGTLTGKAVQRMYAAAKRCTDCKRALRSIDKSLDHIVPLSKGGQHSILNARVICKRCNSVKGRRMPDQLTLQAAS